MMVNKRETRAGATLTGRRGHARRDLQTVRRENGRENDFVFARRGK